jgi:lambda family phage portal protein
MNAGLAGLEVLRNRAEYETANNADVAGVVESYAGDVVQGDGPTLQVHAGEGFEAFADQAEAVWREWWESPDHNEERSGPDVLDEWARSLPCRGEWFEQITTARESDGRALSVRLLAIHPARVGTPLEAGYDDRILYGVERDPAGKPLAYHVFEDPDRYALTSSRAVRIEAAYMLHGFRRKAPGQVRGAPLLSPALNEIASARDWDAQVLDAARAAADWAVYLYTDHPEAEYIETDAEVAVQRRTVSTMPPGWKPAGLQPTHPPTNYAEFRDSKLRSIGRPLDMPLMVVKRDASSHNYSSARLDRQGWAMHVLGVRRLCERRGLDPMARVVVAEGRLSGRITAPAPAKPWRASWTWPALPHVDPAKEALSAKVGLELGTLSLADVLASYGKNFDDHIEALAREGERLREKGLPVPWERANESPTDSARRVWAMLQRHYAEAGGRGEHLNGRS